MLAKEVRGCHRCGLRADCKSPVPGRGPYDAQIFVIGQSPGAQEDAVGLPFHGPSGQVLRAALADVGIGAPYTTNAVKCHPNGNRKARVAERAACLPWLEAEIALWEPETPESALLVAVGEDALKALFPKMPLGEGRLRDDLEYLGRRVVAVLHPASTLHNPKLRIAFQQDIERVGLLAGTWKAPPPYWEHYEVARPGDLQDYGLPTEGVEGEVVGLDTEFFPDNTMIGYSFSSYPRSGLWVPAGLEGAREALRSVVCWENCTLIIHSTQADVPVICDYLGLRLNDWPWNRTVDTAVAAYIERHPIGLKDLTYKHFGIKTLHFNDVAKDAAEFAALPVEEQARYAVADADFARQLAVGPYRWLLDLGLGTGIQLTPEDLAHAD